MKRKFIPAVLGVLLIMLPAITSPVIAKNEVITMETLLEEKLPEKAGTYGQNFRDFLETLYNLTDNAINLLENANDNLWKRLMDMWNSFMEKVMNGEIKGIKIIIGIVVRLIPSLGIFGLMIVLMWILAILYPVRSILGFLLEIIPDTKEAA